MPRPREYHGDRPSTATERQRKARDKRRSRILWLELQRDLMRDRIGQLEAALEALGQPVPPLPFDADLTEAYRMDEPAPEPEPEPEPEPVPPSRANKRRRRRD